MNLVYSVMPKPSKETQVKALKEAEKRSFIYGLTTVSDAELGRQTVGLMEEMQIY